MALRPEDADRQWREFHADSRRQILWPPGDLVKVYLPFLKGY
jgi:hypothetical protein